MTSEREENGPYHSFPEFLERQDMRVVNRKVIETGIHVGLFDSLGMNRATLSANLDTLLEAAGNERENRMAGQNSLFDDQEEIPQVPLEQHEEWNAAQRLAYERDLLGAYFSGHPLDDFRESWKASTDLNLAHPESAIKDQRYTVVGLIKSMRTVITKRSEKMAFGLIEDFRGELEIVAFPEPYAAYEEFLQPNMIAGCVGTVEQRNGNYQFVLAEVRELEDLDERDDGVVHIRLARSTIDDDKLYQLRGDLSAYRGGADVYLHIPKDDGEAVVRASAQLRVSSKRETLARLRSHPLVEEVWKE